MKKCVTAFATADRTVAAGTLVEDNDEVVKGHEAFFVDVSAEPQAAVIPGTDKVGDRAQPDNEGGPTVPDNDNTPEDEGGLPVSTQSGPGAAEAARKQAEEGDADDKPAEDDKAVEPQRRVTTQETRVEQATAEPGEKRNTGRRN